METRKQTIWNSGWMALLMVLVFLAIDQMLKIWVKTNMTLHESIEIASWFKISFIENNGMAFGMEIGSKLFLSVFRIVAEFVSFGDGYAPFLMGRVVDMFYFPLIEATWPQWMPLVGGQDFVFFSPVFNFADACVSVGIIALVLFYRKELSQISFQRKETENTEEQDAQE